MPHEEQIIAPILEMRKGRCRAWTESQVSLPVSPLCSARPHLPFGSDSTPASGLHVWKLIPTSSFLLAHPCPHLGSHCPHDWPSADPHFRPLHSSDTVFQKHETGLFRFFPQCLRTEQLEFWATHLLLQSSKSVNRPWDPLIRVSGFGVCGYVVSSKRVQCLS